MSLIADALKTAQREKERRASREGITGAAVLIPLREPARRFDPRRLLALLALGVVLAVVFFVVRRRGEGDSLPPLPAVAPAMISEAMASGDQAGRAAPPRRTATAQATRPAAGRPVVVAIAPPTPVRDTSAVLQGRADTAAVPVQAAPGELRIAVEPRATVGRLFSQAVAAHRAGDLPSAHALYDRVLAAEPDHADALNNLGIILSAEQQYDRALELLRRAATLAPKNAGTWNNIGTALREQGKSADAIAAFRQALSLDPRHLGARVGLAQQYVAIDALADARTLLEQVVSSNHSYAEAHYTLGQVLERQGDRAGAIREYEAFISVAPQRLAEHAQRVRLYLESLSR